MEQFRVRHHVWLRSRDHGAYLHADGDGASVSLQPVRASVHAAWGVHIHHLNRGDILMLHNAANGRYLAATTAERFDRHGNRAIQRKFYPSLSPLFTIGWSAIRSGPWNDVLLRHTTGRFLRADDRNLRWNSTGVIVDRSDIRRMMSHWVVETIPPRNSIPRLPNPSIRSFDSVRTIMFVRESPEGDLPPIDHWARFLFTGRSIFNLRTELADRLDFAVLSDLIMCVRAGLYGRLTPLVTDLPRNDVTMEIIVLTARTIAADRLRHPNIDAPRGRQNYRSRISDSHLFIHLFRYFHCPRI